MIGLCAGVEVEVEVEGVGSFILNTLRDGASI